MKEVKRTYQAPEAELIPLELAANILQNSLGGPLVPEDPITLGTTWDDSMIF